jgi:hypothetical protein
MMHLSKPQYKRKNEEAFRVTNILYQHAGEGEKEEDRENVCKREKRDLVIKACVVKQGGMKLLNLTDRSLKSINYW